MWTRFREPDRAVHPNRPLGRSRGVRFVTSQERSSCGLDFAPVLFAIVLGFVVVSVLQISHSLAGGERGLLLFERACPIYSRAL
jgi:hypothetical protein